VLEIRVPPYTNGMHTDFIKFAIRKSIDFPVVNCAAAISCENGVVKTARICLNSVYTRPFRVRPAEEYITGKTIDENVAEEAADAAVKEAFPVINNRTRSRSRELLLKEPFWPAGFNY